MEEGNLPNESERRQDIEKRKRSAQRTERLWVRDSRQDFDVYLVPTDSLVLNVDNRRFRAELLWAEERLGRSLDPENRPEDERTVESLLLDSSHYVLGDQITGTHNSAYQALRNDWMRRGQDSPLWIRPDGSVRNGNRRLAMVKRLQREAGDAGLQWVEAVILDPSELDEPTLLEMEQREQLTENFKVRYNDIDYLLALREAAELREIDWFDRASIQEVAGKLQSMVEKSRNEVVRDLYAIKYMDEFLEDSEQPGQYHRLLQTLERFRDIGRTMMQVEDEYPSEQVQVLQVLFAAVRSKQTHNDIRSVRKIFLQDREKFDQLAEELDDVEAQHQSGGAPTLGSPNLNDSSEDEDGESESGGPEVANYPKQQVNRAFRVAIDGFTSSGQEDLLTMLREIRNRLNALTNNDRLAQALRTEETSSQQLSNELGAIVAWAEENRHLAQ